MKKRRWLSRRKRRKRGRGSEKGKKEKNFRKKTMAVPVEKKLREGIFYR